MMSEQNTETSSDKLPAPPPRRTATETFVWIIMPLVVGLVLAIKYWPD